jgi:uncharacterized membrane protein
MNKIAFVALTCLTLGACATPVQTVGTAGGVVAGAAIGGPVGAVVGGVTGAVVTRSRSLPHLPVERSQKSARDRLRALEL